MNCKNCGKKVFAKEVCQCGEKAPNVHGTGVAVNSVICSILLVLTVFSLIISASLRYIVNKDLLAQAVQDMDLTQIVVENDSGEDVKLDQFVYDKYINDERITVQNVDNVLNDPFIKNFLLEKLHGYQKYFMDEGDMVSITSDEIIDLIDKNQNLLFREAGLRFLEPDKQELRESLEGLDKFSEFCNDHVAGRLGGEFVKTYFSLAYVNFLEVFLVIILVQWLLVYKFNNRRMIRALRKFSIAFIIPSALIFIPTLMGKLFKVFSWKSAQELWKPFIFSSGILLAVGVILLIVSLIFGRKKEFTADVVSDDEPLQDAAVIADRSPLLTADTTSETAAGDESTWSPESVWASQESFAPEEKATDPQPEKIAADEKTETIESAVDGVKTEPEKASSDIPAESTEAATAENKPAEKEFVFCTKCGNQNRRKSKFCSKCGNKLRT